MVLRPPFALNLRSYAAAPGEAHRHDFSQLVLPLAGRLQLDIGGREGLLHEGRAAFIAPGTRHTQAGHPANRALVLDLDEAQLHGVFVERMAARPFLTVSPAAYRLIDYMGLMLQGGSGAAEQARHWVPLMLDALAGEAPRPLSRLAALMAQVQADPGRPWSTDAMARAACLSVSRLHALFRAELDTTPAAWLSQLRLQRVREWLATTDRPIAELALAAGYSDQNALTRAMRRATGLTPAAWRRQARERA
ncbi:helix-turn-helix domain-containing protein [Variovorax sp. LT1R16]|uniref:helix-turn-helix domain-containing protein n=1 Tax=Variovorax sp. LT1R16 TaxID=3443728 RepID=UPI003F477772